MASIGAAQAAMDRALNALNAMAADYREVIAQRDELLEALRNLLPEVDSEIEQRKFSGNDEDWAELEALSTAAHAALAKSKAT